jgi:hypothetical protein
LSEKGELDGYKGKELAFTGIKLVFLAESCHGDPVTNSEWQKQRLQTL